MSARVEPLSDGTVLAELVQADASGFGGGPSRSLENVHLLIAQPRR